MISAPYNELSIPKNLMSQNWERALAWLKSESWKNIPLGRTEIDGSRVYVLRSSYMGKLRGECHYESHKRYADIQMAIKGGEIALFCLRDGLKIVEPYSEEKDIDFLEGEPDPVHSVALAFPFVGVFFPWDVHMPGLAPNGKPGQVEKMVLKVAL